MYLEKEEINDDASEPYLIETDFIFNCEVMMFVDDKVRIRFFNDFDDPIKGEKINKSS